MSRDPILSSSIVVCKACQRSIRHPSHRWDLLVAVARMDTTRWAPHAQAKRQPAARTKFHSSISLESCQHQKVDSSFSFSIDFIEVEPVSTQRQSYGSASTSSFKQPKGLPTTQARSRGNAAARFGWSDDRTNQPVDFHGREGGTS